MDAPIKYKTKINKLAKKKCKIHYIVLAILLTGISKLLLDNLIAKRTLSYLSEEYHFQKRVQEEKNEQKSASLINNNVSSLASSSDVNTFSGKNGQKGYWYTIALAVIFYCIMFFIGWRTSALSTPEKAAAYLCGVGAMFAFLGIAVDVGKKKREEINKMDVWSLVGAVVGFLGSIIAIISAYQV